MTRWNGDTVLFKSVLLNKDLVAGVFTKQRMLLVKDRAPDFRATLQAAKVADYVCEAHFWTELGVLTPLFEIINANAIVTFLEGDGAFLSHVPLGFAVIAENLNLLSLPPAIVVTATSIRGRFGSCGIEISSGGTLVFVRGLHFL